MTSVFRRNNYLVTKLGRGIFREIMVVNFLIMTGPLQCLCDVPWHHYDNMGHMYISWSQVTDHIDCRLLTFPRFHGNQHMSALCPYMFDVTYYWTNASKRKALCRRVVVYLCLCENESICLVRRVLLLFPVWLTLLCCGWVSRSQFWWIFMNKSAMITHMRIASFTRRSFRLAYERILINA